MFVAKLPKSANVSTSSLNSLKHFLKLHTASAHTKPHLIPTYVQPCTTHTYTIAYIVPSYEAFHRASAHKSGEGVNLEGTDNSKRMQKNNVLQGGFDIFLFVVGASIILDTLYNKYVAKDSKTLTESISEVNLDMEAHKSFMHCVLSTNFDNLRAYSAREYVVGEHTPITYGMPVPFGSNNHFYMGINVKSISVTFFRGYFTLSYDFLYDPNLRLTSAAVANFESSMNAYMSNIWPHRKLKISVGNAPGVINFKIKQHDSRVFCYANKK